MRAAILPSLLALLLAGCGNGSIADIFHAFPEDVFKPPGEEPPTPPPPTGFVPREVKFLEGAQGVTGNLRNIALAQVGARRIAFLAAGTSGCHVVDVTQPELLNSTHYVTTIRNSVLTDPASLAGGQCDAVAVLDNAYVVCVAVGTSATNAVSVFQIQALLDAATSSSANLSAAFVPRTGTDEIAVPGNGEGKAGGVSGGGGAFLVATGGQGLGIGVIVPGLPGTWAALPAFQSAASPQVDRFLDVRVAAPVAYASVQSGTTLGIIAMTLNLLPTPNLTITTPSVIAVEGRFDLVAARQVAGPGNFPLDLAASSTNLFATAENEVVVFGITIPVQPVEASIVENTGQDTISVDAATGFFAIGAGDRVRVYTTLTGQAVLAAEVTFGATFVVRGVALQNSSAGRFVLACAGNRGLRVVQWSNIP
jgi:hypothetical protein